MSSAAINQHYFIYYITIGILFTHTWAIGLNRLESSFLTVEGNNTVISPWSVISTLIPLQIGADEETSEELENIIDNYRNVAINAPSLGKSITALFTSAELLPSYKTEVVTNVPDIIIEEDFQFTDSNIKSINDLIKNGTEGLITDLIKPGQLSFETKLIVINAFYFKGEWRNPFTEIRRIPFYTFLNGNEESNRVEMMFQRNSYYMANIPDLKAKIIEIPYALKSNTSATTFMQIILPDEKHGLAKLIEKLAKFDMKSIRMKLTEVDVYIPKFNIESEVIMDSEVAKKVGLSRTFSNSSNFSKLSGKQLRIDKIISKTKIDVNEVGTEGASGTGIFIVPLSGLIYESFVVDHPFAFYIFEGPNVLFSGTVSNPQQTTQGSKNPTRIVTQTEEKGQTANVNEAKAEAVSFKKGAKTTTTSTTPQPETDWWIHTGKPEYLISPSFPTERFQQPEPKHPSGIRFPYPLSDPTTQFIINLHLKNQSSLNNTV